MWEPRRCSDLNWILKNRNGFKVDWMWIEFDFHFAFWTLRFAFHSKVKPWSLSKMARPNIYHINLYKSSDEIKNMKQPQKIWNKFHTSFVYDVVVGSGAIKILNFKPSAEHIEVRWSEWWGLVGPNRATHGLEDVCRNGVRIQKKSLFHHKMAESCAEKTQRSYNSYSRIATCRMVASEVSVSVLTFTNPWPFGPKPVIHGKIWDKLNHV